MVDISKDDAQVDEQNLQSDDLISPIDIPDNSSEADPLLDNVGASVADNPLSDKDDSQSLADVLEHEWSSEVEDNPHDDDSLNQALIDMHSQF